MLQSLMPCYENMFSVIDKESDETRRMFCGHISGIAIYSSIHPLDSGWLFRFLKPCKTRQGRCGRVSFVRWWPDSILTRSFIFGSAGSMTIGEIGYRKTGSIERQGGGAYDRVGTQSRDRSFPRRWISGTEGCICRTLSTR